ncbi:MAG: DNA alkylation repair protein [Anaerolineales bacterium]
MPAIQTALLQQQAAQLSEQFSNPASYISALEKMLEGYVVPVQRQGRTRSVRPILFTYETPALVLKQLQLEMALQARQQPAEALAIADALWAKRTIETRLLAARLLGATPDAKPSEYTSRLEDWAVENREMILAPELTERATLALCGQYPDKLIDFVGKLLEDAELRKHVFALGALNTLLRINHFGDLPSIFTLLSKTSRDPDKKLRPALVEVLSTLAVRSPKETTYFLEQLLDKKPSDGAQWLARQVAKSLPEESRQGLRPAS